MLRLFFHKEQYDAVFVHDGLEAYDLAKREEWDFIILDWMLPGMDGINLCREIRKLQSTPIILLTARDQESDRILGLELGADDYITKPFSPKELIARIKAVQRRYKPNAQQDRSAEQAEEHSKGEQLLYRNIRINLASRSVHIEDHVIMNLTPKEFDLFCLFIRNPKRVFTREQLLESVWGFDYFGEERTVDVHIKRLRNKVSRPEQPLIATVWGVGYKLEE
jgi:two-component system OmpR family response regulator